MNGFSVQTLCDGIAHISLMAERKTNGGASPASVALKKMREQAGLSVREVAAALGRKPSSYQHYEDVYKKPFLPFDLVRDLADIFVPYGIPRDAVLALAGLTHDAATHADMRNHRRETAARLRQARMAAGYETAKAFAEANGIPQPTYALHESGERGLKMDVAQRYAAALKVDLNWLLTGTGEPPDENLTRDTQPDETATSPAGMVTIDELDMAAGAAAGGAVSTYLENNGGDTFEKVHVRRQWVLPAEMAAPVTAASSDRLKIVPIVGNSMVPDFHPGQRVLVDTTDRIPSPPGVFLVWDGLNFVIKLVEYVPFSDPPKVRLKSKNPDYEPYERTLDEAYIQGRVIGAWQWT